LLRSRQPHAPQRLATALASGFDSLGGCNPITCRDSSVRRRADRSERQWGPVRGAAVDRASRGGLWVRPWPRLGPPWISTRVKVATPPDLACGPAPPSLPRPHCWRREQTASREIKQERRTA